MKIKKGVKKYLIILLFVIILIFLGYFIYSSYFSEDNSSYFSKDKESSFETDVLFLKVGIIENSSSANSVNIKSNSFNHFLIRLNQLEGIANLSESEFNLEANQEHSFKINFNPMGKKPGVYLGELIISTDFEIKKIPIILEIQSEDVLFDSNVNLFLSKEGVISLKDLDTEISIFDLSNIGRSSVNVDYFIKDFDGKTILMESEDLVVESRLDYTKRFDIQEDIELGSYVLGVLVTYHDSVGVSSVLFRVNEAKALELASLGGFGNNFWIILVFGLFFFMFLVLFVYSLSSREKLLKELQSQYKRELKKQSEIIKKQEKRNYPRFNSNEREIYKKELKKIKNQRVKELKNIHKKRIKEAERIRKSKDINKLKRQLSLWESKGYDISVLEKRYRIPNVKDIKKQVEAWKSKGYDTSGLEKKLKNKNRK